MKFLIDKFLNSVEEHNSPDTESLLQIATATLMLEVVRADFEIDPNEMIKVHQLLGQHFSLDETELARLIADANEHADKLVSLQHITRQLNDHFSEPEKIQVVEMMWQVVFADGNLDHYEEHLIRQVAELLYLPHSAFIKARHKAEPPVM